MNRILKLLCKIFLKPTYYETNKEWRDYVASRKKGP